MIDNQNLTIDTKKSHTEIWSNNNSNINVLNKTNNGAVYGSDSNLLLLNKQKSPNIWDDKIKLKSITSIGEENLNNKEVKINVW